jgi:hypothetical protein
VTHFRGAHYLLPPLYALSAPVLVALVAFKIGIAAVGLAMFGADPARGLVDEASAGWAILKVTAGCTLALVVAAALLQRLV